MRAVSTISERQITRLLLPALLLLALVVRLGWVLLQPVDAAAMERLGDQREYLEIGRNLLYSNGLKFYDPRFQDEVYAFRMPGYPAFVVMMGGSIRAVRVGQAVIDTSTVLAIFLLARRWLSGRGGLLAAAIVAVNPYLIYFSGLILTETLFTSMLAWAMVLLASKRSYIWGGLVLVVSILVRPSGILLPVVMGIGTVVMNRSRAEAYQPSGGGRRFRWPLPVATTMLLLTLLALLPWGWRNSMVVGQWVWTTTNEGITRYDGFNPDATGASNQRFVEEMPHLRWMSEVERSEYLADLANAFIRENPGRAVELTVLKAARTWSPAPLSPEFGTLRNQLVGGIFAACLYLLVLLGLWKGRLARSAKTFLLLPAFYFTLVHAASVGSLRYRIPAEPPMAVLAAAGAAAVLGSASQRERDHSGAGAGPDDADHVSRSAV